MRRRRLRLGLLLPIGLVLLVGVLAGLQYRWLGQVSEAERAQLGRTLELRAREFADDFDREIGLAYAAFQVEASALESAGGEHIAERLSAWKGRARFPSLIKTVYLVREENNEPALLEHRADDRNLVKVPWPDTLMPVRERLLPRLSASPSPGQARAQIVALGASSVFTEIPAIVVPLPGPAVPVEPGVTHSPDVVDRLRAVNPDRTLFSVRFSHQSLVLLLDGQEIRQTVLPALAERYFPELGRDRYRVAILDNKGTAIITRPGGVTLEPKDADVATPFFGLRLESARGIAPGGHIMTWTLPTGPMTSANAPSPPIAGSRRSGQQMSVFVEQHATVDQARGGMRVGLPGWHLLLQHADGSLEAAVTNARRRNLWLSFGILAVLATGVCLIVLNARRSERLAAQQMDFVATVSHELRTPLAVIRSAAQNLSAGVVLDDVQTRRYGDLIEGEGRRLTSMVEQVLEYAGLSGGRKPSHATPVAAARVIDDTLSASRALLDAQDFEVVLDVPDDLPPVLADAPALQRALQNLIANALKHAAAGRWLSIVARASTVRGRRELQISVSDRGPGIEATDLPHLFEPFYRGRSALERQVQGNGLGLSLVKRIAEAHGGRVTVRSTIGEGATFTLHLPAATPESIGSAAADLSSQTSS